MESGRQSESAARVAQRVAKTDAENDEDEGPANEPPTHEASAGQARMDAKIYIKKEIIRANWCDSRAALVFLSYSKVERVVLNALATHVAWPPICALAIRLPSRRKSVSAYSYGRGAGVGRGRGVGVARGDGVDVGVGVAVAVAVAVGVGDGVGVTPG